MVQGHTQDERSDYTVPTANGSVNHTHIDETSLLPAPHFNDTQYCQTSPESCWQQPLLTKLDTQTPHTEFICPFQSLQEEKAFFHKNQAPTPPKEDNQPDYDLSQLTDVDLNVPPTHYYSTPADGH